MMDFSQMVIRLLVALALGALMGLERELVGKEAGVRTGMMVAGGAVIFTMVGLNLPGIIESSYQFGASSISGSAMAVIANIVVGVGFLGAGTIIKDERRAHGLTTAAVIWTTAAVGVLTGVGMLKFAAFSGALFAILLYALRKTDIKIEG
ncbi:MAG: MgtC/SapB family protein [Candidatus Liptonbacteria bacterium]